MNIANVVKVGSAVRPLKGVLQLHRVDVVGVALGGVVRVVGRKRVFQPRRKIVAEILFKAEAQQGEVVAPFGAGLGYDPISV